MSSSRTCSSSRWATRSSRARPIRTVRSPLGARARWSMTRARERGGPAPARAQDAAGEQFGLASTDDGFDAKAPAGRRMEDEEKGLQSSVRPRRNSSPRSTSAARSGCPPTATARNTAIRSASASDDPGEPPPRRDARQRRLLGRRDVLGLFIDHDARERAGEKGGAQGAAAARPARRSHLPRRTQAAPRARATRCRSTSTAAPRFRRRPCPSNGARPRTASARSTSCCSRSAATMSASARSRSTRSTESARDLAPIAGLVGSEIRFGPEVSRAYLGALDKRIKAVRDALVDGFGVDPARVLQNAYEPIQYRRERQLLRRAADARHGRASLAQGEQGAAERGRRTCGRAAEAAGVHGLDRGPARLPGRACDRHRHRLPLHHRSHRGVHASAASARAIRPVRCSTRPR